MTTQGGPTGLDRLALPAAAALAVAGIAALVSGVWAGADEPPRPPAPLRAEAAALTVPQRYAPGVALAEPLGRSEPVHLRISRVGIDADVVPVGLNPDRTVASPPATVDDPAGWYRNLATPGEVGPAVLLGHLDTADDRGVFFNLGAMRAGDDIVVTRSDGSTARFTVDAVDTFEAANFPTAAVYGATRSPALRLITCGGEFSAADGYAESVVVFASLTGTTV